MNLIKEVSQAFTPKARRTLIKGKCQVCGRCTVAGEKHRSDCYFSADRNKAIQHAPFMLEVICLGLN